jgi:hypothetical protein
LEIGKLPDPGERMMQSFDALISYREPGRSEPEDRENAIDAANEVRHVLRGVTSGTLVQLGSIFMRDMLGQ